VERLAGRHAATIVGSEVPVSVRPVQWAVSPPCLVEDVGARGFDLRESAYE